MPFRWLALAVFVGALFVSAYHRRRARERETIPRRREGGAMMAARALVAFPLFISPLVYVAHPPAMACDGARLLPGRFVSGSSSLTASWRPSARQSQSRTFLGPGLAAGASSPAPARNRCRRR